MKQVWWTIVYEIDYITNLSLTEMEFSQLFLNDFKLFQARYNIASFILLKDQNTCLISFYKFIAIDPHFFNSQTYLLENTCNSR